MPARACACCMSMSAMNGFSSMMPGVVRLHAAFGQAARHAAARDTARLIFMLVPMQR